MAFSLTRNLFSRMTASTPSVVTDDVGESSFSYVLNRDLYKQRDKIVDDESLQDQEPFPLLSGESIEYIGRSSQDCVLAISNYRLFATEPNGFYSVPLGLVEGIELLASKDSFNVVCKDCRIFRLTFSSVTNCRTWFDRVQECKRRRHKDIKSMFAFIFRAYRKDEKSSHQFSVGEDGVVLGESCETRGGSEAGGGSEARGVGRLLSISSDPTRWREEVMTSEYRRMGLCPKQNRNEARVWRISQCNDKYQTCSTYPKLLLVPGMIIDEELTTAAKFRMSGRLPVVSWRHQTNGCVLVRSSQPLVGMLGWRSPEDEKLLLALSHSCSLPALNSRSSEGRLGNGVAHHHSNGVRKGSSTSLVRDDSEEFFTDSDELELPRFRSVDELSGLPRLKVFDLRSYTVVLGNRAKGGGCECTDYYPNCDIFYKGLPNIHTVRKSFHQLRALLTNEDQTSYLSSLESTQWLSYISQLLNVACEVVGVVNSSDTPCPILVHCSDGWDRTTQVVTLAELMLDPYYRTIKGFRVLLEREWVGFGHRFSDRCGHVTEDTGSRSPIFLQWLDCVHQLLRQSPCDFQFNETFLVKLGQHCFSCLYGTFLCNSMKEREEGRVSEDTYPIWSLLHEGNTEIVNYLYTRAGSERVINPQTSIKYMLLWREMYANPLLTPYFTGPEPSVTTQTPPQPIEKPSISDSPLFGTPDTDPKPTSAASLDSDYQSIPNSHTNSEELKQLDPETSSETLKQELTVGPLDQATELLESDHTSEPKNTDLRPETESVESELRQETKLVESEQSCKQDSPPQEGGASEEHESKSQSSSTANLSDDQTSSSPRTNGALMPDNPVHIECGESHESLHGTHLEAINSDSNDLVTSMTHTSEGMCVGNGHMTLRQVEDSTTVETTHTDKSSPKQRQTHLKIKLNREDSSQSSSSSLRPVVEGTLSSSSPNKPCNGGLLREAINDISPHIVHTEVPPVRGGAVGSRLGVDGLPLANSRTQDRVRELVLEPQRDIQRLRRQLKEVQLAAHRHSVEGGGVRHVEGAGGKRSSIEDQISSALDDESPTSLSSWDCVEREEGVGVRWVPDHAVSHCQGCGLEFWTGLRKHHCRSCGGVFCGGCSDFFCPVPHEQLFQDARVCEKCFYRLDGHLLTKDSLHVPPT